MSLGWIFLWAFLDKLFGLGYATCSSEQGIQVLCEKAWLAGGSPTAGFLLHGTSGPFAAFFQAIQGLLVDWLFMLGLLAVGVALLSGACMRLGTYAGALMVFLMFLASPPTNNPFMDDHIVYAIVLVLLNWVHAGDYYGLGNWWRNHSLVEKYSWLR